MVAEKLRPGDSGATKTQPQRCNVRFWIVDLGYYRCLGNENPRDA